MQNAKVSCFFVLFGFSVGLRIPRWVSILNAKLDVKQSKWGTLLTGNLEVVVRMSFKKCIGINVSTS